MKSLGLCQKFGPMISRYFDNPDRLFNIAEFFETGTILSSYIDDDFDLPKRLNSIIELHDAHTSLNTMETLIKFCPRAKHIFLIEPDEYVLENLAKFESLTELGVEISDLGRVNELINLLKIIGRNINALILFIPDHIQIERRIFLELCPNIYELKIH